jgi:hypothetical protein
MRIAHIDELAIEQRTPRGREGKVNARLIMTGESPQRPDNFSFRYLSFVGEARFSPRHRHNFAQYYYILEGETLFGDALMSPGWLGYMPEGVYYGPQSGGVHTLIVLQHGGPSGQGIIGYDQHSAAFAALQKIGKFEKGLFHPNEGVQARSGQDSYEAIWEHVNQRQLHYPKPEYSGPINMNTNAFPWAALARGVEVRHYGTFTNASYGACGYRISEGAETKLAGRAMCIVLSGAGAAGEAAYRKLTTIYLDEGDDVTFTAQETSEILYLGLPLLSQMTTDETPPSAS